MFKGAAVKVFQHTPLPFYVILCNCEVDLGQGRDRVFPSRTKRTTGLTRGRIGPLVRDVRPWWASLGNRGLCPWGSIS